VGIQMRRAEKGVRRFPLLAGHFLQEQYGLGDTGLNVVKQGRAGLSCQSIMVAFARGKVGERKRKLGLLNPPPAQPRRVGGV